MPGYRDRVLSKRVLSKSAASPRFPSTLPAALPVCADKAKRAYKFSLFLSSSRRFHYLYNKLLLLYCNTIYSKPISLLKPNFIMKKLFLLVALTGAAVAAYCVTPANASTTEALQAKADVYKEFKSGYFAGIRCFRNGLHFKERMGSKPRHRLVARCPTIQFRRAAIRNRIGHHIDQSGRQSR